MSSIYNPFSQIAIYSGLGSSIVIPWQKGTQTLEDMVDLISPYVDADHFIWNDYKYFAYKIVELYEAGKLKGPVIIVGHSNGVLACAKICEILAKHGIEVAYVGAIDPTAARFPVFGGNVKHVSEFWASSGWPAIKRRISKTGASCQYSKEFFANGGTKSLTKLKDSHIGISKNGKVLNQIRDEIKVILENSK